MPSLIQTVRLSVAAEAFKHSPAEFYAVKAYLDDQDAHRDPGRKPIPPDRSRQVFLKFTDGVTMRLDYRYVKDKAAEWGDETKGDFIKPEFVGLVSPSREFFIPTGMGKTAVMRAIAAEREKQTGLPTLTFPKPGKNTEENFMPGKELQSQNRMHRVGVRPAIEYVDVDKANIDEQVKNFFRNRRTPFPHQQDALKYIMTNRPAWSGEVVTGAQGEYDPTRYLKGEGHAQTSGDTSDGASDAQRDHGRGRGLSVGGDWRGTSDHGAGEGSQEGQEPLWRARALGSSARPSRFPEATPRVGSQAGGRGMTGPVEVAIKQEPGRGAYAVVTGAGYPGMSGSVEMLAPELDRLIAALCTARDKVRALNRPRHSLHDPI
jgi:hypothetical protein